MVYTDYQRLELEKEFHFNRYITMRRKAELAKTLGLTERQVSKWHRTDGLSFAARIRDVQIFPPDHAVLARRNNRVLHRRLSLLEPDCVFDRVFGVLTSD